MALSDNAGFLLGIISLQQQCWMRQESVENLMNKLTELLIRHNVRNTVRHIVKHIVQQPVQMTTYNTVQQHMIERSDQHARNFANNKYD